MEAFSNPNRLDGTTRRRRFWATAAWWAATSRRASSTACSSTRSCRSAGRRGASATSGTTSTAPSPNRFPRPPVLFHDAAIFFGFLFLRHVQRRWWGTLSVCVFVVETADLLQLRLEQLDPRLVLVDIRELAQQLAHHEWPSSSSSSSSSNSSSPPFVAKIPRPTEGAFARLHQPVFPLVDARRVQEKIDGGIARGNSKVRPTSTTSTMHGSLSLSRPPFAIAISVVVSSVVIVVVPDRLMEKETNVPGGAGGHQEPGGAFRTDGAATVALAGLAPPPLHQFGTPARGSFRLGLV